MSKIGRNAPCPCGSGRKYKKCCLASGLGGYNKADREAALSGLWAFIERPEWRTTFQEAFEEYWGPFLDYCEGFVEESFMITSTVMLEFCFAFDYRVQKNTRLVDLYLARTPELPAGQRRYLEAMRQTTLRLYEVTSVRPSVSVWLRDLLDGHEIEVPETRGAQLLKRWDPVAARVLPIGASSGAPEIEGGVFLFPSSWLPELLDQLWQEREDYPPSLEGELEYLESLPPIFHQYWLEPLLAAEVPILHNSDGDQLVFADVHFQVTDRSRLVTALDQADALERSGEEEWDWSGQDHQHDPDVSVGHIWFLGEELLLATSSRERAERGRALLEALAGDSARYQTTVFVDPRQVLEMAARVGADELPGRGSPRSEISGRV